MKNIINFFINQVSADNIDSIISKKKTSRFLPCNFCGNYKNFIDIPNCKLNFSFDKELIKCECLKLNNSSFDAEYMNEYQILKYDFIKNKCVARKTNDTIVKPFTVFYFQQLTEDFTKIFYTDFDTVTEAENHKLPKDSYNIKKMQWICLCKE